MHTTVSPIELINCLGGDRIIVNPPTNGTSKPPPKKKDGIMNMALNLSLIALSIVFAISF
jgi:hypothetical protein